jgi:hypothetical protein
MKRDGEPDLDRELERLETRLPDRIAGVMKTVREGSAWRRVPIGSALIVGGVFSFLPVLGIWMIPLGVVLIAKDVPPLRSPTARMLAWAYEKTTSRPRD